MQITDSNLKYIYIYAIKCGLERNFDEHIVTSGRGADNVRIFHHVVCKMKFTAEFTPVNYHLWGRGTQSMKTFQNLITRVSMSIGIVLD